jgi:transcriptional regulator with XRE-family HTH domain
LEGIGLVELGKHSGLSARLLSKIERQLMIPPLPTLVRIALVFGVGLEHFFSEYAKPNAAMVRKADRLRHPDPRE